MRKEKKMITLSGFIIWFIINFLVWNLLISIILEVIRELIGINIINLLAIPLSAWLTFYISTCDVFRIKKMKIKYAKGAFIVVAIIIILFAIFQFACSRIAIMTEVLNNSFYQSSVKEEIINKAMLINLIQTFTILLIIPFEWKWIKKRCISDKEIVEK